MKQLNVPQSGSLGAQTASHNRAGQYLRARRSPVQPVGTGRRAVARANFGSASNAYGALTAAQQAAWAAYADSHPVTDSLGQSIKLTGHQMFVAINAQLLNVGSAIATVPPISSTVAAPVLTVSTLTHLGILTLTLTPSGMASDHILVAFSKPQSSGTSFCKTFWQQTVIAGNSTGAATYGTAYVAQFGLPPAGSRVFYKLTPVNQYGVAGVPVSGFMIVS